MLKNIILQIILLGIMILCGTGVMKIFDMLLNLGYDNIWIAGFKVGIAGWLLLLILNFILKKKNTNLKK